MSKRPGIIKLQDGFTLLELLITTAVVGIIAAVAVPQFSEYKARAHDANVQSDLRSVFTACKGFWTFEGSGNPCLLTTISNSESGFTPSADVEVTINSDDKNTEYDFYATASHVSHSNVFAIDHRGIVSKISVDVQGEDKSNGGKDDKNNGRGCSEEAHKDPHNLGGNAAGGCGTSSGNSGGNSGGNKKWWKKWGKPWWKK